MSLSPGQCRGCGKPIMWGVTEDNKRIPLDPRAPVYEQDGSVVRRTTLALVSHFVTCPAANEMSNKNRYAGQEPPLFGGR